MRPTASESQLERIEFPDSDYGKPEDWPTNGYTRSTAMYLALDLYERIHGRRMPDGQGSLWDSLWRALGFTNGAGGYFSQVGPSGWPSQGVHTQSGLLYRENGVGLSEAGKKFLGDFPYERLVHGIPRLLATGLMERIVAR
jgi:hypothetical protein